MNRNPVELLSEEERKAVVEAIRQVERKSSAEIRVHLESHYFSDVLDRAVAVFDRLGMRKTEARNGVLLYVALKDRVSAIIGDENVNRYVGREFWKETDREMNAFFSEGRFTEGICGAILRIGEELQLHFPGGPEDANELPDDISYGD